MTKVVDSTLVVAGNEKDVGIAIIEDIATEEQAEKYIAMEHEFTPDEYKKLVRKIDSVLMPLLMIAYGLQYIDKTSLSSGVIFGLKEDTHLIGNEYANLSAFFYMAYFFAQIPMQWLMQRLPFGRTLSACVLVWGGLVMCLAACNNYATLVVCRVLIGWFESVITPGFAILSSAWYLRSEQSLRQGIYYSMNHGMNIFMSVIIYFIAKAAESKGVMSGWRVINLFLGGVTVFFGILMIIFVGGPTEVWWLTKREKQMAHARLLSNATGGSEQHPWNWDQVKECLKDRQFWHAMAFNFFALIPNGALTTFQFVIFKSFGFSSLETILYALPMFAVNFIGIVGASFSINRWPVSRWYINMFTQFTGVVVWLFVGLTPTEPNWKWARYGFFLFAHFFVISIFMTWPIMSLNIAGRTKKSFFSGCSLMMYCVGNTVGSQIFIPRDAPAYRHGLVACGIVLVFAIINSFFWWRYYVKENARRDAAFAASGMTMEEREHQTRLAGEADLTDKQNPHFRYSL